MKRSLVIAFLLSLAMSVMAQNVNRVAILKTVDEEGSVPYGVKLQLRSSLIYAISHTPGYEALERVDLPSIMDEQKFQRSGLVSDSEIREIGRMNGADYVLVAEAALYDENNILVTAKLLDVVTGRIKQSADPQIASKDPDEMKEACGRIARTLLGMNSTSADDGYVDLGLPSGKKWKTSNAIGLYTPNEAARQFGSRLPSKANWDELRSECKWKWTGNGYRVTGPNGNSITLPAEGYSVNGGVVSKGSYGYYLSSTTGNPGYAWSLAFVSEDMAMQMNPVSTSGSVRLIK